MGGPGHMVGGRHATRPQRHALHWHGWCGLGAGGWGRGALGRVCDGQAPRHVIAALTLPFSVGLNSALPASQRSTLLGALSSQASSLWPVGPPSDSPAFCLLDSSLSLFLSLVSGLPFSLSALPSPLILSCSACPQARRLFGPRPFSTFSTQPSPHGLSVPLLSLAHCVARFRQAIPAPLPLPIRRPPPRLTRCWAACWPRWRCVLSRARRWAWRASRQTWRWV